MTATLAPEPTTGNYCDTDPVVREFMARRFTIRSAAAAHQKLLCIKKDMLDATMAFVTAGKFDRLATFFAEVDAHRRDLPAIPYTPQLACDVAKATHKANIALLAYQADRSHVNAHALIKALRHAHCEEDELVASVAAAV
jgi:hypothetical protein